MTQKTISMMSYFGKNGILQVNYSELWHVISVANKTLLYSYQMGPGSKESIG
jgi:hypothetical protein